MVESKKEYLRRILNVKRDDPGYADMNTFEKEYNNFIRAFNFNEIRGGEIEKIFVNFHLNGTTPAKLVELKKGKNKLKKQLLYYNDKAKEYYKNEIEKKRYAQICERNSAKNIQIELMDLKRNHSLIDDLSDIETFLSKLDKYRDDFIGKLYDIIDLIFRRQNEVAKIDEFPKIVKEVIDSYTYRIKRYEKSFNKPKEYYTGKNDNPYKNIFLYCLNSYIRSFYSINVITMEPGKIGKLTTMIKPDLKDKYTLKDVASIYSKMSGETYEKSYNKIKKQFQKSEFMKKMKRGRSYEFPCLEVPLATYIYYSKKNHTEPKILSSYDTYDKFIVHYLAPLLRANMYGEHENLLAFNHYIMFVNSEIKKLTSIVNDAYLDTWLKELFWTSDFLYHKCFIKILPENI